MTAFRWILLLVDILIALALAAGLLALGAGVVAPAEVYRGLDRVYSSGAASAGPGLVWQQGAILVGLYLLLSHGLYVLLAIMVSRYDTHFRIRSNNLEVTIALSAVEESLRRAVKKLPEIYEVWVRIYKEKGREDKPLRIYTGYSTYEGTNVKEVTDKIREVIRLRFQEIIDIPQEPEFEIALTKFTSKEPRKGDTRRTTAGVEADFRGPQYPTDYDYPA
ncbi:MAG: hypothetical protein HYY93_06685 [Planctomycetes bacterium]|nr:hypothetical protein [Planctomycetota bacterium]